MIESERVVLPNNLPAIATARLPSTYESAKTALANCEAIDECKDWADKMAALASYGRQANDDSLVRLAMRIQARAIRKAGELLHQISAQGARSDLLLEGDRQKLGRTNAAREAGFSEHQQKQALRLANIPQDEFEKAIEDDQPPTITELADLGKAPRSVINDPDDDLSHAARAKFALRQFCSNITEITPEAVARYIAGDEGLSKEFSERLAVIDEWISRLASVME